METEVQNWAGDTCPRCGVGRLSLGDLKIFGPFAGRVFVALACDDQEKCKYVEVAGIADEPCPKCGDGRLILADVTSRRSGKTYIVERCDRDYGECDYFRYPGEPPPLSPLPGHGKTCPACEIGKMLSKQIAGRNGTPFDVLSCTNWPACKHSEFLP